MAFDPQTSAAVSFDIATIEANYLSASFLASAFACIANDISEWYGSGVIPSEEVFREVDSFYGNEEPTDPETAANFLLLVRAAQ